MGIPLIWRLTMIMISKKLIYKLTLIIVFWNLIILLCVFLINKLNNAFILQMDKVLNFTNQVAYISFYCFLTIFIIFICAGFYRKDWFYIIKSVHLEWAVRNYFQSEIHLKIQVNLTKTDCCIVVQDFDTFEQEKTFNQIESAVRNKITKLLREYTLSAHFEYRNNAYCLEGVKIR